MQVVHIAVFALLAAHAAFALPSSDVVPETGLLQAQTAHAEAAKKVQALLQAGQTEETCEALANTTIADLESSIAATQGILDQLDKGEHCEALHEDIVQTAQYELANRTSEAATAAAELVTATNAPVQLAPQAYSHLKTGDCAWIKEDPAYTAAHATYEAAVKSDLDAKAAVTSAEKYLADMITEAARLELECECRTQETHAVEWEKANENNAENEKAWTQAHNMLCVLEHLTYADCTFGSIPKLVQPILPPGVVEAVCAAAMPPPGTGFDGTGIVAWEVPPLDKTVLRQTTDADYNKCGVVRNAQEDHFVAIGDDQYGPWVPYHWNGQQNTGCANSCNGGVGIDLGSMYASQVSGEKHCDPHVEPNQIDMYARTTIYSEMDQEATFTGGSDDGFIAWMNGVEVFAAETHCACYAENQHTFTASLKEGANNLVVKVGERDGHFGFLLRTEAMGVSAAVHAA